ncbi:MAG: 5-formyltetrahydrofolate cyclo-ligase [Oscillospiraceae bacterium]|jgi:5-formyltetrahydrofolate cyclo-ligase|nr:5-formyltetrahydrofolate cyclo-ligase [Oscillospiraceae bacterium]
MALPGLTKRELRSLYPPLPDGGAAARRVVGSWEANGFPQRVFCYVSGKDECSTAPILCFCIKNGIPLAVPLCEGRDGMTARVIQTLSQLRRGRFGILEPPVGADVMEDPAVAIVPGLAFDREGRRLGRGGGYYDRWLARHKCRTVGLCHESRLIERIPQEEWDIPVEWVQTGQ